MSAEPGAGRIRVLIADDEARVRRALRLLLDTDPAITVVGEAATGEEAIRLARAFRPDVVLMDIQMPSVDGLRATGQILEGTAGVRVLILTTFDLDEYVYEALQLGASGFLLKNAPPDEILRSIHTIHAGNAMLAPEITARLIAVFANRKPLRRNPLAHGGILSEREVQVARLVARGLSNHEIGRELSLSPETVKTYVSRMLTKLDVRDRTQLAVYAAEAGLLRAQR